MRDVAKAWRELKDWLIKNPQEALASRKHLQEKLLKKRFLYGDDAILQTTLVPLSLKRKSLDKIRTTALAMDKLIDKVIKLYFEDDYVREYFPIHYEIPKEWIYADPGYTKSTIFNRLDVLFDGKNLKYIEFNTDNPGGKGWVDMLEYLFHNHPLFQDIIDFSENYRGSIISSQFDSTMNCLSEFGDISKPRVALVSYSNISSRGDEEILRDYFIERGVEANLIDPRDFEYRNNGLYSNNVRFHGILRSMTSHFFLQYPREMKDFMKAVTTRQVCMINSFRAVLGSQKSMLAFLTNPLNYGYFTDEEVKLIENHIPWTRKFDDTITLSKEGSEISLKPYILRNRETLVIKPSSGAGGQGVLVGKDTDPLRWNDAIEENIGSPNWIVQDYVPIPTLKIPIIKKNKVVLEEKYINLSPYVFGGKYAGILGRVSDKSVINVSAGGGMIPVFPLKEDTNSSEKNQEEDTFLNEDNP